MAELIPFDTARERILEKARLLVQPELVELGQAHGRILAEDLIAPINVPPHDNSAMDGIAIYAGGKLNAGTRLRISQRIAAGVAPLPLDPGTAARIFTGAVIPDGANCVIPQEELKTPGKDAESLTPRIEVGQEIELTAAAEPGQHVRAAGSDIAAGRKLLPKGTRLDARTLGIIASLGIDRMALYRQLRVGVLCSGDELVEPGHPLDRGQIYDSNSTLLCQLLVECGMCAVQMPLLKDQAENTRQRLVEASQEVDVLLTAGGVSVGEEDHVRDAIESEGQLDLWRIAVKPGKPLACGQIAGTPIFGLPGNPVSGFVTFLVLVLPYLKLSAGQSWQPSEPLMLPATFDRPGGNRTEFLRAQVHQSKLHLFGDQGSNLLTSVQWAQGLIRQEPGQTIKRGDYLPYWSLHELM